MIEQGFNYADSTIKVMTDVFETRVENLEPKEDKRKSSAAVKKIQGLEIYQEMETNSLSFQSRRVK